MARTIESPNTGTTVGNQIDPRELWKRGVQIHEQQHDFFMKMEGRSKRSVIITETDTSKGRGQKITFTNMSGLYGPGKQGEELFEAKEDFEELRFNDYELTVDFLRHAVRWTARTEEWMGMRGEIANEIPQQLGEWLGREKTDRLFMMFNKKGGSANYIYANGKGNADALTSADVFDYDNIVAMGTQLKRLGGRPAKVGATRNGQPIHSNCIVATTEALFSLENDSSFKQIMRDAGLRGGGNYIFEGGYHDIRGHFIKEYCPIDHDGVGPIGSPLNPKAELGNTIPDASTTAFAAGDFILGGGSADAAAETDVLYFKHFPKYAYKWLPSDIHDITGESSFYVLIVNPPGGANGNKIGFYKVSANNGNKLTVEERLTSVANAANDASFKSTVGNVTWDDGVWSGLHTESHPIGSTIVLANSYGVPLGYTLMLGAGAAFRGYGRHRAKRWHADHEDGFVNDTGILSIFGQTPRKDRRGRCNAFMHVTHAIQYAGLPIPTNIGVS